MAKPNARRTAVDRKSARHVWLLWYLCTFIDCLSSFGFDRCSVIEIFETVIVTYADKLQNFAKIYATAAGQPESHAREVNSSVTWRVTKVT